MRTRTKTRRMAVETTKLVYHHGPLLPLRRVVLLLLLLLLLLLQALCMWKGSRTKPPKTTSFAFSKTRAVAK